MIKFTKYFYKIFCYESFLIECNCYFYIHKNKSILNKILCYLFDEKKRSVELQNINCFPYRKTI